MVSHPTHTMFSSRWKSFALQQMCIMSMDTKLGQDPCTYEDLEEKLSHIGERENITLPFVLVPLLHPPNSPILDKNSKKEKKMNTGRLGIIVSWPFLSLYLS